MPIFTLARSYGRHPGGFAIWPALLKAPRKISLLSTHIYWYYQLFYYCYRITFGLKHFLSFDTSLKYIMGIFGLVVCLGEYPHCGPFIMIPYLNSFYPQIITCLSLHQPWRGKINKGESWHEEEARRERDFFRNEELEWKITKRRSNILASEPFLQFTCLFFLLPFSLAISHLRKCYCCWPPSMPGALSYNSLWQLSQERVKSLNGLVRKHSSLLQTTLPSS